MSIKPLIETLSATLKFAAIPQEDKEGSYHLQIGSSPQIFLKDLNPGIFLEARILPIPQEGNKEALLTYLMKANFLGQGTGSSTIGIDSSETDFTLTLILPFNINYQAFHDSLEDYLNYLDYWQETIINFMEKGPLK